MTISIGKVSSPDQGEKQIETYLVREIRKLGGTAYKFNSEQRRGVPDRLCVLPGRVVVFVECKRPGARPRPAQIREMQRLRETDQLVTWVSTKEEIDSLTKMIKQGRTNMIKWEG